MDDFETDFDVVEVLFGEAMLRPDDGDGRAWLDRRARELVAAPSEAVLAEVRSLLAAHAAQAKAALSSLPERLPTERFGPYQPEALIGRGGTSAVYRAHRADGLYRQEVALKILARRFATPDLRRRFDRERQLLASLNHPHITRLLDGGISEAGDPYLIAELVEGEPITEYCNRRRLGIRARLQLLQQACSAVECAHGAFILHLDLKPSNILVSGDGQVKLLDFGAASLLAEADDGENRTRGGPLTPRYASPEQLRGEATRQTSDVFSLGLVAYELLCGGWAFGDPESVWIGVQRVAGEVKPKPAGLESTDADAAACDLRLPQLRRWLRGDLANILHRTLEDRPANRYATVAELEDELERYLDGRPVRASGTRWSYRAGRFLRRYRWQVAATAVAAAFLLAASAYAIAQYGRAQRHLALIQKTDRSNLGEVYQEVGRLAGSAKARMLIVENSRRDLDSLFRDEPSNPAVRQALAESYLQLAQLQGEPFAVSRGETQAARESYRKALQLSGSDFPSRAIGERAQQGLIELMIRSGDYREAARDAQQALEPARLLWEKSPPGARVAGRSIGELYTRFHLLYGHALLREADRQHSLPGVDLALQQFQKTAAVAEQVRRRDPAEADLAGRYRQYIGYAYDLRSDYTGNPADAAAAVAAHRRTAESSEREFQRNPHPKTQRDLADALVYLGWSSCQAGASAEGLRLLQRAVTLMEPVAQADPQSREAALDLAVMYFRLGAAEVHVHRFAAGLQHLLQAERLAPLPQPVRREDRETAVLVSQVREAQAQALAALGRKPAAAAAWKSAVAAVSGVEVVPDWRRRQLETASQEAARGIFPRP